MFLIFVPISVRNELNYLVIIVQAFSGVLLDTMHMTRRQ